MQWKLIPGPTRRPVLSVPSRCPDIAFGDVLLPSFADNVLYYHGHHRVDRHLGAVND